MRRYVQSRLGGVLAAIAALSMCLLLSTACSAPGTGLVVGDSLVQNTIDDGFATDPGVPFFGYPGAAPCDYGYSPAMWSQWNTRPHPRTVVLEWSGNNLTSCMQLGGANAVGDDLVQLYRTELTRQAAWYYAHGTRVVIEAPPCHGPEWRDSGLELAAMEQTIPYATASTRARLAVCPGDVFVAAYRQADRNHLSPAGAKLYAEALLKDAGAT